MPHRFVAAVVLSVGLLAGCNDPGPANPTFPLTVSQARLALRSMRLAPKPMARPLLVLQGYLDSGFTTEHLRREIGSVVTGGAVIDVTFLDCGTFDQCRRKAVAALDEQLPSGDPRYTVQVDAIGVSMGGLVGRYAARPSPATKQLRLARLFTIATPNLGASSVLLPVGDLVSAMAPDSPFLQQLNSPPIAPGYQIIPYVWLNDNVVGAANAAPPGMTPWWLAGLALQSPHIGAMRDDRIIADIARRLRYETPFTISPPAPLPPP